MYVPSPMQILQPPGYVLMLFERMSWRIIPLDGRAHIPDNVRLWQGDSVGHWEGDTLVVDTTNLNGKTWLNEVGDVVSHAEHVVEHIHSDRGWEDHVPGHGHRSDCVHPALDHRDSS